MTTLFQYSARSASGRIESGSIAADTREDALARLKARHLTPLALKSARQHIGQKLTSEAARDLARTLAQLVSCGLPVSHALQFASEELPAQAASAASRMLEVAKRGAPPSSALKDYTGPEARLLAGILRAGESSGRLAEALDMAATSLARTAEMRGRLTTALIYPAFIVVATFTTLLSFLLLVVPTLGQAFQGNEGRLPQSTQDLLALSSWLRQYGLALGAGGIFGGTLALLSPPMQRLARGVTDQIAISPLALGVVTRFEYATFAGLSALSLDAGMPGNTAFEAAAGGIGNKILAQKVGSAVTAMRSGEKASNALERLADPPRSLLRLMHVGEQTGRLSDGLRNAAALLNSEAEQRLARIGAVAGPAITLVLGALVASVVASLFLGLLSLSDVAAL